MLFELQSFLFLLIPDYTSLRNYGPCFNFKATAIWFVALYDYGDIEVTLLD